MMNEKERKEFNKTYRAATRLLNEVGIKIKRLSNDELLEEAHFKHDPDVSVAANFVIKYRQFAKTSA